MELLKLLGNITSMAIFPNNYKIDISIYFANDSYFRGSVDDNYNPIRGTYYYIANDDEEVDEIVNCDNGIAVIVDKIMNTTTRVDIRTLARLVGYKNFKELYYTIGSYFVNGLLNGFTAQYDINNTMRVEVVYMDGQQFGRRRSMNPRGLRPTSIDYIIVYTEDENNYEYTYSVEHFRLKNTTTKSGYYLDSIHQTEFVQCYGIYLTNIQRIQSIVLFKHGKTMREIMKDGYVKIMDVLYTIDGNSL